MNPGPAFDPLRVARWLRRAALPASIALFALLYLSYGLLRVPRGMDTMPEQFPAGTLCVIDKRPGLPTVGSVVFVDVHDGTLLTRVVAHDGDRVVVAHDNAGSRWPSSAEFGSWPLSAVRGLVLTGLVPESGEGTPRGR